MGQPSLGISQEDCHDWFRPSFSQVNISRPGERSDWESESGLLLVRAYALALPRRPSTTAPKMVHYPVEGMHVSENK
jgi:hypothetical protein